MAPPTRNATGAGRTAAPAALRVRTMHPRTACNVLLDPAPAGR